MPPPVTARCPHVVAASGEAEGQNGNGDDFQHAQLQLRHGTRSRRLAFDVHTNDLNSCKVPQMALLRCVLLVTLTLLAAALPGRAQTVGGFDYAPEYDFSEFWAATDGRFFRVIVAGNPFPATALDQVKQQLLPVMQAEQAAARAHLHLPAAAGGATARLPSRAGVRPGQRSHGCPCLRGADFPEARPAPRIAGRVYVFGIYCRNDLGFVADHGLDTGQRPRRSAAWPDVRSALPRPVRRSGLAPLSLQSVVCPLADPA